MAVILLLLAGSAAVAVNLRIARDGMGELTFGVVVAFGVFEALRVLITQLFSQALLNVLAPFDEAFEVQQERRSFGQQKAYLLDFVNHNLAFLYVALTAAFGDPRDFAWTARCYQDDCLADIQITLWCVVLAKSVAYRIIHLLLAFVRRTAAARTRSLQHRALRKKNVELRGRANAGPLALSQNKALQQADAELTLEPFLGTEETYREVCGLAGLAVVFGCAAPGTLMVVVLFLLFKSKHEAADLLFFKRRPRAERSRGNRAAQAYLGAAAFLGNILIPTVLTFSFTSVSHDLFGTPECPIQVSPTLE
ncbi:hypothetical protein T484DRAFT_2126521 [Baffinella frigidus]|nr:hypothetical protein T484DRAFT_2126521 [Cryptophyta sp. CCMP2293]